MGEKTKKKGKKWLSANGMPVGRGGYTVRQPVILPPLRGGGFRCSVKPASRGPFHFNGGATQAFARAAHQAAQLGTGEPAIRPCCTQTQRRYLASEPPTAPARVTSSR